jgi:hypothetical protein
MHIAVLPVHFACLDSTFMASLFMRVLAGRGEPMARMGQSAKMERMGIMANFIVKIGIVGLSG